MGALTDEQKREIINLINHAAFNLYKDDGEVVKVVYMQDVANIIEEEL